MADILSTISVIAYCVAGILFILAIIFWFVLQIPTAIGDLSGKNARKSVARLRNNNQIKTNRVNLNKNDGNKYEDNDGLGTELLNNTNEDNFEEETTLLENKQPIYKLQEKEEYSSDRSVMLVKQIVYIHTDEII